MLIRRAPRRQCRFCYLAGAVDRPYGKKTNQRETPESVAALASLFGFHVGVFPHSGGAETKGEGIAGRGCFFSGVGSVFVPP